MDREQRIKLRIDARNKAAAAANRHFSKIRDALRPLDGKKVKTVEGNFTKAAQKAVVDAVVPLQERDVKVYVYPSAFCVWAEFTGTGRTLGTDNVVFEKVSVAVAEFTDGKNVLSVPDAAGPSLKCDYSYDSVRVLINKARELQDQATLAKSDCGPFSDFV